MPSAIAIWRRKRADDAATISQLRRQFADANRRAEGFETRLKRIVTGTVTSDFGSHNLTLCIKVDRRVIRECPRVLDDAVMQLREDLMREARQ